MTDVWEVSYGLNPDDAGDASGDPDGDDANNLEEYQRGTNPFVSDYTPPEEEEEETIINEEPEEINLTYEETTEEPEVEEETTTSDEGWTEADTWDLIGLGLIVAGILTGGAATTAGMVIMMASSVALGNNWASRHGPIP
jgi:hypothetical protein